MSTTDKATPRPWARYEATLTGPVRTQQFFIQPAGRDDPNDFGDIIAELPWQHLSYEEREANAALIVRAVNNEPKYIEAIEALLDIVDVYHGSATECTDCAVSFAEDDTFCVVHARTQDARALLASARGEAQG